MNYKKKDFYHQKAKKENVAARSFFKIEEMDKRYNLFKAGDRVIDFGASPGGWLQYISKRLGRRGTVQGFDLANLEINLSQYPNCQFFQEDVFSEEIHQTLEQCGNNYDVLVSDMAPKTSGIKFQDQMRSLDLVQRAFELGHPILKYEGDFLFKVFQSQDAMDWIQKDLRKFFKKINYIKPKSSRSQSQEIYVLCRSFKEGAES